MTPYGHGFIGETRLDPRPEPDRPPDPDPVAVCAWCGRPWETIDDLGEPCATGVVDARTGEVGFIGPHERVEEEG